MICALIGRGRHASMLEEWEAAAKAGADLVEIRVDCLRREPDMKRLLAKRPTPLVVTIRRSAEGGLWRGDEEKRRRLLREAIAMGVDYIDLEIDVAGSIPRFGKTKRIVSHHEFKKTNDDLHEIAAKCVKLDADIVKMAVAAATIADASRTLEVAAGASVPTLAIAMGEVGLFTRILGAKYGAPFTYAGFNPDRVFAPGMPQYSALKNQYAYERIGKETEVYAVVGDPIAQSLSPAVHNAAFTALGLDKVYIPLKIPEGKLEESLAALAWLDIKGYSVTIPHKEAAIKLLSRSDKAVEVTGSCNTIEVKGTERIGHNTDYRAAVDSLEDAFGGRASPESPSPLFEKQALILGAGGAARSIAFGLERRGVGVTITNRHEDRATELASAVGGRTIPWTTRASGHPDILINCTPVGMHPNVDDSPLPPAGFKPGMVVFDTVYHPENTMLLKLARGHDCKTITGVEMFVRQAAAQSRIFTGLEPPEDLMREVVKRRLGPLRD